MNMIKKGHVKNISTKDLKRNLTRKDLFFLALGQIIGAGILSMLGIAIGMTGRSIFLALVVSVFFIGMSLLPIIFVGGTLRLRGGDYSRAALLGGKKWAGIYIICFIATNLSLSMYAISFADYLLALIHGIPHKWVSLGMVTLIFLLHYFGTKQAAQVQSMIILCLAIAFALFTAFGLFQIQSDFFAKSSFITHGIGGLVGAGAYMTFAVGGASLLVNYSAEAEKPTRDIPFVMMTATLGVALLYGLMSIVASGVLPLEQVVNQPLTHVAKDILPAPLYIFFIVCGALFGLTGTMNSQIGGSTKPIMQACVDGWFPHRLAKLHPKHKTPIYLLAVYYLIAVIPIMVDWDISLISNSVLIIFNTIMLFLALFTMKLPKVASAFWQASRFKVSQKVLNVSSILAATTILLQLFLFTQNISWVAIWGNGLLLGLAYGFGTLRAKYVVMEDSIEGS